MIFGVDTASFQPLGTYDPGSWEVVNIEDPGIAGKVARNDAEGRPTDAYIWCYSNDRNADFFRAMIQRGKALGITRFWLDYEEEGREGNWRIDIWRQVAAEEQVQAGLYSNDWRVDHSRFMDLAYWYAGYPDPNDGQWKGGSPKASRPVQVWQFTSGGGLDRNVIIDEAWFANWIHATPPTPPLPQENSMEILIGKGSAGVVCYLANGSMLTHQFTGAPDEFGRPADAVAYQAANPALGFYAVPDGTMDLMYQARPDVQTATLAAAVANAVGGGPVDGTPPGPTDAQKAAVQSFAASTTEALTALTAAFA